MPGSSVTMARRVPVRRLNSVDLPTLGRPTMTSDGSFGGMGDRILHGSKNAAESNLSMYSILSGLSAQEQPVGEALDSCAEAEYVFSNDLQVPQALIGDGAQSISG